MIDYGRAPEICQEIVKAQTSGQQPEVPVDMQLVPEVPAVEEVQVGTVDAVPEVGTLSPAEMELETLPDADLDSLLVWAPSVPATASRSEKVRALAAAGVTLAQLGTSPVVDVPPPPPPAEDAEAVVEEAPAAPADPIAAQPVEALEPHGVTLTTIIYLKAANLNTVGDVEKYIADNGALDGLDGIGEARAAKIIAALAAVRA